MMYSSTGRHGWCRALRPPTSAQPRRRHFLQIRASLRILVRRTDYSVRVYSSTARKGHKISIGVREKRSRYDGTDAGLLDSRVGWPNAEQLDETRSKRKSTDTSPVCRFLVIDPARSNRSTPFVSLVFDISSALSRPFRTSLPLISASSVLPPGTATVAVFSNNSPSTLAPTFCSPAWSSRSLRAPPTARHRRRPTLHPTILASLPAGALRP